ncbi:MAG: 50S ribosomal protein L10 [Candidatus Aenigmatarchaeota archaeon]
MVTQKKINQVDELRKKVNEYSVIGLIDLYKLPSRQFQFIRRDLRGQAEIMMRKRCVIERSLKLSEGKKDIQKLLDIEAKEPALILTNINPFKLFKLLEKSRSSAYAKPGDISPKDIIVPEGPTKLPAGPAIGEFQRLKIPAMVQDGKIHIRKSTTVVKKGEAIKQEVADLLKKLDIQPMEIGINLLAAWEDGVVFTSDTLRVDEEEYLRMLNLAYNHAVNLSVNISYPTKETIELLLMKAFIDSKTLGLECNIIDKGIIEDIIKKAEIQAQSLKKKIGFNG